MSKDELLGAGILALLLNPLILLIAGVVLIAVFLGLFAVVYITLQAYHLMTAVIFLVVTLMMFYIAVKSGVVTQEVTQKYPWMWLLIPGSFAFGYVAENVGNMVNFTVAPLSIAAEQQSAANFAALLVLVIGCLYIVAEYLSNE